MTSTTGYETKMRQPFESGWLPLIDRAIFLRATIASAVIGSILTLINQSGWLTGSDSLQLMQLILVFLLPFAVVTVAQAAGLRQAHVDSVRQEAPANSENFITTAVSHGIPARAVVIGLVIGSLNAIISLANELMRAGDLAAVSIAPLGQAYALPVLFGILSQAISYRRYRYL